MINDLMDEQVFSCGHKPIVFTRQSKQFPQITMRLCQDCLDMDCDND
ncbi:hypothetical protein NADRNF5_1885 [Nitrosopumilus adriaticus]|uniref:Uncharacterized protein n=1 Tax=Nitrosopumilus adriaticus TaxID=1580092 RepID=A0A0D5C4S6_9ARCH|nr:hypothetical protein NADRNF5_1885 [Nitrosopumilus adriaticus]